MNDVHLFHWKPNLSRHQRSSPGRNLANGCVASRPRRGISVQIGSSFQRLFYNERRELEQANLQKCKCSGSCPDRRRRRVGYSSLHFTSTLPWKRAQVTISWSLICPHKSTPNYKQFSDVTNRIFSLLPLRPFISTATLSPSQQSNANSIASFHTFSAWSSWSLFQHVVAI